MDTERTLALTKSSAAASAQDGKPSILVVEDQGPMRSLIASMLTMRGLSSEGAANLAEARDLVGSKCYDIIFVDVRLPDGWGLGILEEGDREGPLVVVVSATSDITSAIEAIHRGAVDYIVKPFSVSQFCHRVDRVLALWRDRVSSRHHERSLLTLVRRTSDELSRTVQEINSVYDMAVAALGAALNMKDHETESHCRRVSENSVRLGRALSLSAVELRNLSWGSYLHDVGKIGVPERLLLKPGALLPAERKIVERHPILGFDLLKGIRFLSNATEVVLSHHERCDGSGYPHGLSGEAIPLQARIFSVMDTLDAMTSERPYRGRRPLPEATAELARLAGRHYDPEIIGKFLSLPESTWLIQGAAA